ncbi:MAG: RNA polymerase sigma factor [Planctomycetales bacterium]
MTIQAHDPNFAMLMARIRDGSGEAFLELVETYGHHVYRAVRHKLNRAIRVKFDSGDFVQAVWASFFENRQRVLSFANTNDLINFLSRVAKNKVIDECRRRLGSRARDVNREVSLDQSEATPAFVSQGPTVSEMAMAGERLQRIVADQPTQFQRIVNLRVEGATHEEIAEQIGVSAKTVQRVLKRLERRGTST